MRLACIHTDRVPHARPALEDSMNPNRPRFLYALLFVPVLYGGFQGGCKCGKDDTVPPDTHTVETVKPEDPLKAVSIEPSTTKPMLEQSGTVFGSGFKDGAKVDVGGTAAGAVLKDSNTLRVKVPGMAVGVYDVTVTNPDGTTATIRRGYTVKASIDDCRSVTVNFDFDRSDLTSGAKSTLDGKTTCYKDAGSIAIGGHADERGTTEYNLALGEKRAETVKTYLTNAGITAGKIKTTSYGEERPVANGHDESSWAQNRRAELTATE
jgi:peptidoglycan-associated lipoprotein